MNEAPQSTLYKPLGEREIRLLVIQPGDFDSIITCDLVYTSIENGREYDALSYVWGNPAITHDILIDGNEFTISQNLYQALKYFRALFNTIVLWVDAICINQADNVEKGCQVQMMADIYREANTVRCWVGRYYEETDLQDEEEVRGANESLPGDSSALGPKSSIAVAFALLLIFGTNLQYNIWEQDSRRTRIRDDCPVSDIEAMTTALRSTFAQSALAVGWRFIQRLSDRPYWYRVWIQQEVICAHEAIIHCGFHYGSILQFGRTATAIGKCLSTYPLWDRPSILRDVELSLGQMDMLIHRAMAASAVTPSKRGLLARKNLVYGMLAEQYSRGATDARDKVYGIAGLIEPWLNGRLVVSYTKSLSEVYCEATRLLLEQSGEHGLQILCQLYRIPQWARINLPSWCPDLSHTFNVTGVGSGQTGTVTEDDLPQSLYEWNKGRLFTAAGNTLPDLDFSDCGTRMICHGLLFSSIKNCTSECKFDIFQVRKQIQELPIDCEELQIRGAVWEELWRTLCTDRPWLEGVSDDYSRMDEAPTSWGTVFDLLYSEASTSLIDNTFESVEDMLPFVSRLPGAPELSPSMDRQDFVDWVSAVIVPFWRALRMATLKRRFITSSNGSMGLVPIDAKEGDCICIVFGCRFPLIMRPVEDHYMFIGESYIHGWMDGQAMKLYEAGELEKVAFEIW